MAASLLAKDLHPFCEIGEFEQFRKLAFEDPAAARTRFELRRRSTSRSVVRVYYGPPGTGKTLTAVMEAVLLADPAYRDKDDYEKAFARFNDLHGQVAFVTFHQSLQYEDMIESIRPRMDSVVDGGEPTPEDDDSSEAARPGDTEEGSSLSYHLHHGPILQMIRRAAQHPEQEHVLVIDEINRGDLSRILGPLISSIEPDKRVGAEFPIGFEAQYSRTPELESRIFMPSNLHILGTMNSADRNIALVDYALRRRFDFVECPPRIELLSLAGDPQSIDMRLLLEVVNRRIRYLLDRDHCIGHGYFMGCKSNSDVIQAFARRVLPLLNEYFFGNESNLLLVVGDRINGEHNIFKIERREEAFGKLFGVEVDQAADLGYREHEAHVSISLDRRFWNPDRLIPGPDDDTYAVAALKKIYLPKP
jgi:5-methylcytosine-specific restriction protein B